MSDDKPDGTTTVTEHEAGQVERANAAGLTPVMFVHGLWLLPSSWDRWAAFFETAGYVALTPGFPDDPETTTQAAEHPEVFAHKSIGQVADHFAAIVGSLAEKPAIIGHSFGGLLAQILAGRGLAAVSVALDPAPFRGVLPLPISALTPPSPPPPNPPNRHPPQPPTSHPSSPPPPPPPRGPSARAFAHPGPPGSDPRGPGAVRAASEKGFRRCRVQRFPRVIETCLTDRSSLISPPFARMEVPRAA